MLLLGTGDQNLDLFWVNSSDQTLMVGSGTDTSIYRDKSGILDLGWIRTLLFQSKCFIRREINVGSFMTVTSEMIKA